MDHFFHATINHNFGRRRLRGGSQTWVYAFLAERGLTITYTGKGETRDDKKTTATRTMTQAGSKQQPVEGEAQSAWISTWQGWGCRNQQRWTMTMDDDEDTIINGQ